MACARKRACAAENLGGVHPGGAEPCCSVRRKTYPLFCESGLPRARLLGHLMHRTGAAVPNHTLRPYIAVYAPMARIGITYTPSPAR